MYISIKRWRDLEDGHLYDPGDPFPHDQRELPQERIDMLMSPQNKAGFAVIEAVSEKVEEKPKEEPELPKKATRGRKKAS